MSFLTAINSNMSDMINNGIPTLINDRGKMLPRSTWGKNRDTKLN